MTLEKMLRSVVLAGIFVIPFVPLFIANSMFFPFITGKNFGFRILVEVITFAWLALAVVNPAYRPRRSWIWGAFAIFVLVIGVADMFGANTFKSIWSNYERMEGWVTLAHLLAYLTVMYAMLTTETLWRRLIHTSIGVSVIAGLYGILQLAGFITINQGGVRLDATFGNATYLAVYMLFHLFLTALMWDKAWREENGSRIGASVGYGVVILLQAFILFFTATRGAILGALGGAFLSALLLVIFSRNSKYAWRAGAGVIAGIVILAALFFGLKNTSFVQNVEPLRRLAEISTSETTVSARFMNWSMAWAGIKERPILGWGQENYNLVFNKYYNPKMYGQEPWFDRVHNIFFDWLIAGGFVGLLAYIGIFVATLLGIWKSGAFTVSERSIITGLLAGYTFQNLFVFDNITSYILFAMVLGFVAFRVAQVKNSPTILSLHVPQRALAVVSVVAVVLLWGTAWGVNASAFAANRALITALTPKQDIQENITGFKDALSYDSFGAQEIREQLIQGSARIVDAQITPEAKGALFELAATEMQKQIESAPEDARFPFFMAILHDTYGLYDQGKGYSDKAHELSPAKQSIRFQQGINARLRGDDQAAFVIFKEAYELEPAFNEARVFYAIAALRVKQDSLAKELVQPLITQGIVDQRLVGAYAERGDYRSVAQLWEGKVAIDPQDAQARFALAASYFAANDKPLAIKTLEAIAKDMPDAAPQAQALIEQIRNGTAVLQ